MNQPRFPSPSRSTNAIAAVLALALALSLAACSRIEAPARQAQVPAERAATDKAPANAAVQLKPAVEAAGIDKARAAELMRAIFSDDFRAGDDVALVFMVDSEDAEYWRMSLYAARELPDGRTVVVVNGSPSDKDGADHAGHATPGMLNAYTLRRTGEAWQVIERYENVEMMGTNGSIGAVKWIDLGAGRSGIILTSGGTWFGNTIANAEIFDLDGGMRSLGAFAEYSSNLGACLPETGDCWEIDSKISAASVARAGDYADIVVEFEGTHFRIIKDTKGIDVQHPTRLVRQTARYRFNGKEYVLVSGQNPVPDIAG